MGKVKAALSFRQFSRFLVVGGLCALLNLLGLYFLTEWMGFHYLFSCSIIVVFVNAVGYFLNRIITFSLPSNGFRRGDLAAFLRYNVVTISGFFLTVILMYILVDHFQIWYMYSSVFSSVVMIFFNFFLHKIFTYSD